MPFACSDWVRTCKNAVFSTYDCHRADNATGLNVMYHCAEYSFVLCMHEFSALLEWWIILSTDGTGVGYVLLLLAQWGNSHWFQGKQTCARAGVPLNALACGHLQGKGRCLCQGSSMLSICAVSLWVKCGCKNTDPQSLWMSFFSTCETGIWHIPTLHKSYFKYMALCNLWC